MNVVVSAAGRRGALVQLFREALDAVCGGGRIVATDVTPLTAAGHLADRLELVPRCSDPAFIPFMLELCQRDEIGLVVPTIDTELPMYAAHREAFAAIGTTVLISTPEVVAIGADKARTFAWLTEEGFPTVRTVAAATALGDASFRFPAVVKPRQGSASIGVAVVTRDELAARAVDSTLLAQELATGEEHTYDVWVDTTGTARCAVARRRLEVRAGEVSKGVTVRDPDREALVLSLAERLPGAFGVITVQLFADGETTSVIEINPRFGGGFPLASAAGAPFVVWILEDLLGRPSTCDPTAWRPGVVMLRYDAAVFSEDPGLLAP